MEQNFDLEIQQSAQHVFDVMAPRITAEEMEQLKDSYEYAREAHKDQKRKSGHPYIIHPIAVASIASEELKLDLHSVMCAFLHDVVEDTPITVDEIRQRFGDDVAFLVDVVTKKKKESYKASKQVDNFKQLLDSMHYDIRALMVKLADRLHNMRTLASMRPDKQMKIAGETDYFYAPLANRLGLFDVKTDLENLAFKYRCEMEYNDIERDLHEDELANRERLSIFVEEIDKILADNEINGKAEVFYRRPYSIWRKMKSENIDLKHVENRYYIRVTFKDTKDYPEKRICLRIYSLLTDRFKEKPNSFTNQIDQAKENAYKCIKLQLLSDEGIWEDVQICSEHMVAVSKLGCMFDLQDGYNVASWMKRFKMVLEDMADQSLEGNYMDSIVSTLYYDDIMVFTPDSRAFILPKDSTVLDFAFEQDPHIGTHAKYARINGHLSSVKTELQRGDCVEIGLSDAITVKEDWLEHVQTYNAKRSIHQVLKSMEKDEPIKRCPICQPIPGGDIIGFREPNGIITVHRRSCPAIIEQASQLGDNVVNVEFKERADIQYPVTVAFRGIDRYHLLMDMIEEITNGLGLSIDSITTETKDEIAEGKITFLVHSVTELVLALKKLYEIEGIEEVKGDGIR
ncbi:MAG: bifunctional (p)ppGpp synthetase/guanosine-3',5'-bis(diphosphate) 3'-pyrophosphohydrolase [Bacteroidales bacterium]|nr:bifunctional (p)ppGpp synthetase/guanosine-3',5'-bis(diphosphate) 3'-pyrophosphohydrolase [Candidatus Cryptobacteroides caccocaballi]